MIRSRFAAALMLALLAPLGSSCAILMQSDEHVGGGASLSDAARAANPDSVRKKKRPLDVGYTIPPSSGPEVTGSSWSEESEAPRSGGGSGSGGAKASSGDSYPAGLMLGVVAGGGSIGGPRYDGFGAFGLDVGGMTGGRWRFDLLGLVSPIQFSDESLAGSSFKDEFDLSADLTARYYLTPEHTFLGVYPIAGMRFGTLFWNYARPVLVYENGIPRKVKDDLINHFSIYGGAGVGLMQLRHVHVGAQLTGGVRIYSWATLNGFDNDLFPSAGFVQLMFEAGYKF